MRAALPPGYRLARVGPRARLAARDDVADWVAAAIREAGSLHRYALDHAAGRVAGGRGVVAVLDTPAGRWAVRHYHRGGAAGPVLADRYLRMGTPRPFTELAVSAALRARGVATPEVLGAAVYPAGAIYRGDVATAFVPGAADLARLTLADDRWPEAERVTAWRHAGALLATFFATGAVHADLNLRNVLVAWPTGAAHLLDLDRCTRPAAPRAAARAAMLARFHRSRRKLEQAAGRTVGAAELAAFAAGLAA